MNSFSIIDSYQGSITNLNSQVTTLNSTVNNINSQVTTLNSTVNNINSQVAGLNQTLLNQKPISQILNFQTRDYSAFSSSLKYKYTSYCYSPELNLYCSLPLEQSTTPLYSSDGITWNAGNITGTYTNSFYKGCYGVTSTGVKTFLYTGIGLPYNGVGPSLNPNIATSTDGINWTSVPLQDTNGNNYQPYYCMFNSVTKQFIIVTGNTSTNTVSFLSSSNATTWSFMGSINVAACVYGMPIVYNPDTGIYLFGCVSFSSRQVFSSPNLSTWTQIGNNSTLPSGMNNTLVDLVYSSEHKLYVCSPYFRNYSYYSSDGINWTQTSYASISSQANSGITYCREIRTFFVGTDNNSASSCGVWSNDLVNWYSAPITTTSGNNRSAFGCWASKTGVLLLGPFNVVNNNKLVSITSLLPSLANNDINMRGNVTPSSSSDTIGNIGDLVYDSGYLYIKTLLGWRRITLGVAF